MALSGMAPSLSGQLVNYWKFEPTTSPEACDSVYDEIGTADLLLFQDTAANSGHFVSKSGIANQNTVISAHSGHTNIVGWSLFDTNGDIEQWHEDNRWWKVPNDTSGDYSFGGWFYLPLSLSGNPAGQTSWFQLGPFLEGSPINNNRTFLFRSATSARAQAIIYNNAASTSSVSSTNSIPFETWFHMVFTVDAVNSSGHFYIDGSLDASGTSSNYATHNYPGRDNDISILPEGVGIDAIYEEGGRVAEFGIWSGVLAPSAVNAIYNSGSGVTIGAKTQPAPSAVFNRTMHDWKFSEIFLSSDNLSGNQIKDSKDLAHLDYNFTAGNESGYYQSTAANNIHTRSLSGVDDSSEIANGQHFDYTFYDASNSGTNQGLTNTPYTEGDYCISTWIRSSSNRVVDTTYDIFHIAQSGAVDSNDSAVAITQFGSGTADPDKIQSIIKYREDQATSISASSDCLVTSDLTILQDKWIHYAVAFNRERGAFKTWINGSGYSASYKADGVHYCNYGWNKLFEIISGSGFRTKDMTFRMAGLQSNSAYNNNFLLRGSGTIGDLMICSGSFDQNEIDYLYNSGVGNFFAPGATGTSSGSIGGYMLGIATTSGTSSGSIGGYLLAIVAPNSSSSFSVVRPAITAWEYDVTKLDPSGYRHVEDEGLVYYPIAKGDLIGGFDAQSESGIALDFGRFPIDPVSDFTSPVQCMAIQMSDASGIYFDTATEVARGIGVTDAKLWLNDRTDITNSGLDIQVWYQTSGVWLQDHTMASGGVGVSIFPTSESTAINLGIINSPVEDLSISDYVYMVATLPAGTYTKGQLGGLGNNWDLKVSYTFSAT